jgi:hypothetical protein
MRSDKNHIVVFIVLQGDTPNRVYGKADCTAPFWEIRNILKTVDPNRTIKVPPFRPDPGSVLVYKFDSEIQKNDWCADGYVWRHMGVQRLPKNSPWFTKYYFQIVVGNATHSQEFKRIGYRLLEDPLMVLVQYLGDNSVFKPYVHGNSKKSSREYIRTLPSTLKFLKMCPQNSKPKEVYNIMTRNADASSPHITIRDAKQVENARTAKSKVCAIKQETAIEEVPIDWDAVTGEEELLPPSNSATTPSASPRVSPQKRAAPSQVRSIFYDQVMEDIDCLISVTIITIVSLVFWSLEYGPL